MFNRAGRDWTGKVVGSLGLVDSPYLKGLGLVGDVKLILAEFSFHPGLDNRAA